MKTRLTPPEIRDYRAHTREETLPARSLQQRVRKKLAQHAIKRLFSAIFRSLGELFRAHARIKASQGVFAHRTQRPGDAETNTTTAHPQHGTTETAITSAPKNRTKNAHFSPAKAMAVSNHRASSPAAPTRSSRGRRRDPISTHSHAIPPTHTSRLDTQSLKFQAIHRATNHRRQTTRQHARPHRCGGRRRAWLRRPWAAAGPGQATHRHPRPIGGRREACGAWPGFETTRRTNHQHTRPHRCGGRRRPGCGTRGRQQGLARQHTGTPTDWRPPRGLQGLAGLRTDAPSEARGADGERAGRPRGGRRSGGAPSSPAPRSTTRPWGASTTRQRVGRLAAPHPSTPIVQQAITLSPAPRRG